jgi:hypothetical protein
MSTSFKSSSSSTIFARDLLHATIRIDGLALSWCFQLTLEAQLSKSSMLPLFDRLQHLLVEPIPPNEWRAAYFSLMGRIERSWICDVLTLLGESGPRPRRIRAS